MSDFDANSFLRSTTSQPGVYQMYAVDGQLLYIGKAKNLKNRLSSYFRQQGLAVKTASLVKRIARIDVTVTNTETEALLLEQNLIKQNRPPYNILLRDDKSYPYIYLSDHRYPRLAVHRGAKKKQGKYFGPYPSALAVKDSLSFLQKTFRVRQCEDSFFNNRSRPCLQFQINRCSGPCVNLVDQQQYAEDVKHTVMFLEGKNSNLIAELADAMEQSSAALEFEQAAGYRDQIQRLQQVQARQFVEGEQGNVDIVAMEKRAGVVSIQIMFVRDGRILGSKSYFPKLALELSDKEVLQAFIGQYYLAADAQRELPSELVLSHAIESPEVLQQAFSQVLQRQLKLTHKVRGNRKQWLKLAMTTAAQNLVQHLANRQTLQQRFEQLQDCLALEELPQRLECFDISHSHGEATVASCVVFDSNGPLKSDYRRFNIEGITPGDDYAAMQQALQRRYSRLKAGDGKLPDILFIDGGKGQLQQALSVLEELQIDDLLVIAVAKGPSRKAGMEQLIRGDTGKIISLAADSSALHLIQHIRDESHRFAVTGHQQRRDKTRRQSTLESIPGVGPKKRRELLRHFGGLQEIIAASVQDLARVPGISDKLAADIHAHLHSE